MDCVAKKSWERKMVAALRFVSDSTRPSTVLNVHGIPF
jgi:hypothetical protein